jgi:hypothetical protein
MSTDADARLAFEPLVRHLVDCGDALPIAVVCPICGASCNVYADESWSQDAGDWIAEDVRIECTSEPGTEPSELETCMDWDEWHNWHYRMPYVDWLPIKEDVLRQVQARFRFEP